MTVHQKGKLKIFLGYAAGVGKTYAMLKEAHDLLERKIDVVIGYVEPHMRPETTALIEGLEQVPLLKVMYKGKSFNELDLNGIMKRNPKCVLIDELAHTNTPGLRHEKRYGDIEELLNHGIDVYSTLNIQHIESLHDIVEKITGIAVRERIPDRIVDAADQIKLVDIEPEELIDRLSNGQIYQKERAEKALDHFFTVKNLTALRETALRRIADTIQQKNFEKMVNEHILVGVSSSPTSAKVIRTAARLVQSLHAKFTCLYVALDDVDMSSEDELRLKSNLKLAEQLGATIITVKDDGIVSAISNYAHISGVTKIVVGKTLSQGRTFPRRKLTDQLNERIPNIALFIVPDQDHIPKSFKLPKVDVSFKWSDFGKMFFIFFIATLLGLFFEKLGISESNMITIYIFAVLLIAFWTDGWILNIISSALAVLTFNFFFTTPIFSFEAYHHDYPMTFTIMFIAGFLTSSLMKKIRKQEKLATSNAYRVEALLEANRNLQGARSHKELIHIGCHEMMKITELPIVFYEVEQDAIVQNHFFECIIQSETKNTQIKSQLFNANERAIANWVVHNQKRAGMTTDIFKDAQAIYLPIFHNDAVIAVLTITLSKKEQLPTFERQILQAVTNEFTLAYEQYFLLKENETVAHEKKMEQIQSNLLRSISHDLRTPLTTISGNVDLLKSNERLLSMEQRKNMYEDLSYNANRLVQLVENLLAASKLSNGNFPLTIQNEVVEDVLFEVVQHIKTYNSRPISLNIEESISTAKMDSRLISQILHNLIDNAVHHTAADRKIFVNVHEVSGNIRFEVIDEGDGLSEEQIQNLLNPNRIMQFKQHDQQRGLGIGLILCQNILQLHQSTLTIQVNEPRGTIFGFTLESGDHE